MLRITNLNEYASNQLKVQTKLIYNQTKHIKANKSSVFLLLYFVLIVDVLALALEAYT